MGGFTKEVPELTKEQKKAKAAQDAAELDALVNEINSTTDNAEIAEETKDLFDDAAEEISYKARP